MHVKAGEAALGPLKPQVYLLVAPRRALREMIGATAARVARDGPVRVLDGGNLFDAHAAARLVGEQAGALERIQVARAFTCYQMEALLARQAAAPDPVLVLDLLATYADENAPLAHRNYLMEQVIGHVRRLARAAPVLVGVAPDSGPPLDVYLGWLANEAQQILRYEPPEKKGQMRLF